jgi:hypothetical protein
VIQIVDRAVEEFLRARVPLTARAVDVSFDPPDRTWGAGLTRPTVNVFLWDISRDPGHMKTGIQQRLNQAGDIERRRANPVVDLGYLITAWATELRDEHQLLGSVLECVLSNPALPPEFLPERFVSSRCGLSLAPHDRRLPGDFWSALDGRLKPGLQLQVALPVEVFAWQPTAARPGRIDLNVDDKAPARTVGRSPLGRPARRRAGRDDAQGDDSAAEVELTRRRRSNGALVMEGRPPRKPEPKRGT